MSTMSMAAEPAHDARTCPGPPCTDCPYWTTESRAWRLFMAERRTEAATLEVARTMYLEARALRRARCVGTPTTENLR